MFYIKISLHYLKTMESKGRGNIFPAMFVCTPLQMLAAHHQKCVKLCATIDIQLIGSFFKIYLIAGLYALYSLALLSAGRFGTCFSLFETGNCSNTYIFILKQMSLITGTLTATCTNHVLLYSHDIVEAKVLFKESK